MALSTIVKISSINNLSDARYCAGMGVDLMGFCIDKEDTCYITPLQFKEITGWISGVKTVAEIESSSSEEILPLLNDYKVNYFQVNNIKLLDDLLPLGKPFIYKISLDDLSSLPVRDDIHYYLLDFSGHPTKEQLSLIKESAAKHSLIVSCGENKSLVKDLLGKTKIKGIELKGGQEISPGLKDFDSLSEILEMLEIE